MAPKQRAAAAAATAGAATPGARATTPTPQSATPRTPSPAPPPPPAGASASTTSTTTATTQQATAGLGKAAARQPTWDRIVQNVVAHYLDTTPQRTKLLDAFMAFLVAVGALQFLYCVLAGNYPFNAFLSGFAATVGQFVLTASLRIQTTEANKGDFPVVSPERLILHFFCVNFIN
ncbi:hypothetical protein VTH06DRAFT_8025 [Thermothelomyces fergusii]